METTTDTSTSTKRKKPPKRKAKANGKANGNVVHFADNPRVKQGEIPGAEVQRDETLEEHIVAELNADDEIKRLKQVRSDARDAIKAHLGMQVTNVTDEASYQYTDDTRKVTYKVKAKSKLSRNIKPHDEE